MFARLGTTPFEVAAARPVAASAARQAGERDDCLRRRRPGPRPARGARCWWRSRRAASRAARPAGISRPLATQIPAATRASGPTQTPSICVPESTTRPAVATRMLRAKLRSKKFELVNAAEFSPSTVGLHQELAGHRAGVDDRQIHHRVGCDERALPMTEPEMRAPSPMKAPSSMNELLQAGVRADDRALLDDRELDDRRVVHVRAPATPRMAPKRRPPHQGKARRKRQKSQTAPST